ncbi:DUF6931 family protein [Vibrio cholerae]|uniref:DUF6931 family protein n=1 Tax=Vibrio cholerae TaxID=666 RepID=UPI0004E35527|nr:hypothetical protein [Vibrio cholerae]EGR1074626.1 Twin-arginine translocation pathway signal [Vibrio cholerae]EGR2475249.1 Twin-arginine translocation pathway signal [Vibrio cholerae]KFD83038.1 hypothetical protein DN41_3172 [Vibrio cholerae]GHZ60279.1 Twin-arginine translocation pathway signal [Vibrio cholerae]
MKLLKIPHESAQNILDLYEASPELLTIIKDQLTPYQLIQIALKQTLFSDVVIFLAHSLPIREAIWWASLCASLRTDWNEDEWGAIRAAKAWVHNPDENNRRYAEDMAKKSGLKTGAGWAAQAVFWSGGSMTASKEPIVPPPPYLYAHAVAGCISLSAILPNGEHTNQNYNTFIEIGLNIAQGGNGKI